MTKRNTIRAIDDDVVNTAEPVADDRAIPDPVEEELVQEDYPEDWDDEPTRGKTSGRVAAALAIIAIIGWTVFYGWTYRLDMLTGGTAEMWVDWTTTWAIPVLLVVALWLLAMRSSTREAKRFGNVAQALSTESARLEDRLAVVNRELSLAREFLTTQSRELEYLGRSAGERLSENADRLQSLVQDNSDQVESIATVSAKALENMDRLRDNLPVIANSAKDVSNQIGNAGRTAQDHLDELITGFERLNEFGAASERQVGTLRKRVDAALVAFKEQADQLGSIAEQRFVALREDSESFRGDLDSREVEALASIRNRFDALRDEMGAAAAVAAGDHDATVTAMRNRLEELRDEAAEIGGNMREREKAALDVWDTQISAMKERLYEAVEAIKAIDENALSAANEKLKSLFDEAATIDERIAERNRLFDEETAQRRAGLEEFENNALAELRDKIETFDSAIAASRTEHLEQIEALARDGDALTERIAALGATFDTVRAQGEEANATLAGGIERLGETLSDSREALDGTDMAIAGLTDASVRLLELIQASAKHSREDLPVAMKASEERLAEIERRTEEVKNLLDQARLSGEAVTNSMDAADTRTRDTMAGLEDFQERFSENAAAQFDDIERLRASVAALGDETSAVSEASQGELRDAITALETKARNALTAIETEQADRIARIADSVGEKSASAIDTALAEHTENAIAKLDDATGRSSEAARQVAGQLRDQLVKLNELTGNLENRIAQARERAHEQVDSDFSRRVALITESLNSNSIDIAKALSSEVTDTSWASYLRGDRGIFTRRAVRLIDNTDAREIAELYDTDNDFREHVSRYIHDFESMLRTVLSTRDGHAVSVTLLSSDMGKLYVVLAQALERLRQ